MNHRFPVSDLLTRDDVAPTTHQFEIPAGSYDDLTCTEPLVGEVRWQPVSSTEILGSIEVTTAVELVCDRCLTQFSRPIALSYQQIFSTEAAMDSTMEIDKHGLIDLFPSLLQEINVSIPMKVTCRPDCPGITITE